MTTPELTLSVPGMTCGHCERTIKRALAEIGLPDVAVDLGRRRVTVAAGDADLPRILEALAGEGYDATAA
jgi:copper chaperone